LDKFSHGFIPPLTWLGVFKPGANSNGADWFSVVAAKNPVVSLVHRPAIPATGEFILRSIALFEYFLPAGSAKAAGPEKELLMRGSDRDFILAS